MKLDVTVMKSMTSNDYRVLTAVEYGMKSHELVPVPLIISLAKLRHGGTHKILSSLLRDQLLSHDQSCGYDGYRITNAGQDVLALHNLKISSSIHALGRKIGTGKESDVYLAIASSHSHYSHHSYNSATTRHLQEDEGIQVVAKFHRLGRTSFRNVKKKRDYFFIHNQNQQQNHHQSSSSSSSSNWLFLSTLSAKKEFSFMKALHHVGIPTPIPIAYNRHVVVMSLIRGMPLYQIVPTMISFPQAKSIFEQAIHMIIRLLCHGLIHCDFNEFNLIVDLSGIQDELAVQSTTITSRTMKEHLGGDDYDDDDDSQDKQQRTSSQSHRIDMRSTFTSSKKSMSTRRRNNNNSLELLHSGSSIGEYYVRHSGKSMAGKGALSIHTPIMNNTSTITNLGIDDTSAESSRSCNIAQEEKEESSQPISIVHHKSMDVIPKVTLIDFPQMISINHPNAKELFQRDVDGLRRFFGTKLNCPSMTLQEYLKEVNEEEEVDDDYKKVNHDATTTPVQLNENEEECDNNNNNNERFLHDVVIIPTWDDLVKEGIKGEMIYCPPSQDIMSILKMSCTNTSSTHNDDDEKSLNNKHGLMLKQQEKQVEEDQNESILSERMTLSRVAKNQLRIDQLLKVSGFSQNDATRDAELYYFEKSVIQENGEEEDDDDEDVNVSINDNVVEMEINRIHEINIHNDGRLNKVENDKYDYANDSDNYRSESIEKDDEGNVVHDDNLSIELSTMTLEQKHALYAAEIEARAKLRVMQYVKNVKNKDNRKGSFANRNSNKTFVKGKRIFHDYGPE